LPLFGRLAVKRIVTVERRGAAIDQPEPNWED
jgi:hypothetical protein